MQWTLYIGKIETPLVEQGWKYLISSDDFTCSFVSFRGLAYVHFQDPRTYLEKGLDLLSEQDFKLNCGGVQSCLQNQEEDALCKLGSQRSSHSQG